MPELTLPAHIDELPAALAFLDEVLEGGDCPMATQFALDIALEEMFVNVAHYAYPQGGGDVTLVCNITTEPAGAAITLKDSGTPYNPLAKLDPDITLSAEDRDIGGLGIFMVKKSMDTLDYQYEDSQNVFTMTKAFPVT